MDTQEPIRSARLKYIDTRWEQLLRLVEDAELRTLKFLTLSNAGGAAATLSFLGASEAVRKLCSPKISLGLFVLGLIFVGVLNALSTHRIGRLFREWKHDSNKYISGEITWGSLTENDEARVKKGRHPMFTVAYAAFICFIAGALVGMWALFSA